MTKARQLANLGNAYDDGALSNRNLIINGAMQVAQRGTSFTGVTSDTYTVDRFQYAEGSGGGSVASTITQSSDSPDQFGNSLKLEVTTADTLSGGENVTFRYRSEGRDGQRLKFGTSSAEKFTVSFWAKASVAGTYSLQIFGPARSALSSYTINSANTWEYKTITFNGDTSVALPNTSASGFEVVWHLDAGSSDITSAYDWGNTGAFRAVTGQVNLMANTGNTWQITGVQLEVGDTATPFEHRSYGDELAKCQRYCWKLTKENSGESLIAIGFVYSPTSVITHISYPQVMRAIPSASISSISNFQVLESGGGWQTLSTLTYGLMKNSGRLFCGISNEYTTGTGSELRINGGHLLFDAEL
jgi:hypothetical protein